MSAKERDIAIDDGDAPSCRICYDHGTDDDVLVAPCACRGGQEFIHRSCLMRCQRLVMVRLDLACARDRV